MPRPDRLRHSARCGAALAVSLASLLAASAGAQENPTVVIEGAGGSAYKAAVQRFGADDAALAQRFREEIGKGLEFSSLFTVLSPEAFLASDTTRGLGEAVACPDWRQIGTDVLVGGMLRRESGGGLGVDFEVWDVARCQKLGGKHYSGGAKDEKRLARRVADEVVGALTGKPGVSSTEAAFISNRDGAKELYLMDVDGSNVRAVTRNKTINEFPSWGPDGDTLLYTSFRENRMPGLFVLSRGGKSPGRVFKSLRPGASQYRGVIDPTGQKVAVVMSIDGATKIFTVDRDGGNPRQVTDGKSLEVSPSWSPDGRRIAFVSDRSGGPQVYVMNADGSSPKRVTFQGGYNTGAAWSPDGKWIAYESRIGGQFDIWLTDPEGGTNVPLVEHPATDESATWSPDSRKLMFSSKRRGRADLYVVDLQGGTPRRITQGEGDATSPAWGPYRPELR
jgi:TolB protein